MRFQYSLFKRYASKHTQTSSYRQDIHRESQGWARTLRLCSLHTRLSRLLSTRCTDGPSAEMEERRQEQDHGTM